MFQIYVDVVQTGSCRVLEGRGRERESGFDLLEMFKGRQVLSTFSECRLSGQFWKSFIKVCNVGEERVHYYYEVKDSWVEGQLVQEECIFLIVS